MKRRYILDLNIIQSAQTLVDAKGKDDDGAARLVTELIAICHSIVTCPVLYQQYSKRVDRLKRSTEARGPDIFSLYRSAMTVSDKWLHVEPPREVEGEKHIPEDDRGLVRLAMSERAHLVTADRRLNKALEKTPLLGDRGLQTLTVSEALAHVKQP